MKLLINLRHLEKGPQFYQGALTPETLDLDIHDDVVQSHNDVHYAFRATLQNQGIYIEGTLETAIECVCVRCLQAFKKEVKVDPWITLVPLEGDEKVEIEGDCADLTPVLREDMLLDFPHHPVCKTDCEGLKQPGSDKPESENSAPKPAEPSNVWSALDKLNLEP